MCPACIATVGLVVAGATSTGGLIALALRKLPARPGAESVDPTSQLEENRMNPPRIVSRTEWIVARKELADHACTWPRTTRTSHPCCCLSLYYPFSRPIS
jgi:hypothetical protein